VACTLARRCTKPSSLACPPIPTHSRLFCMPPQFTSYSTAQSFCAHTKELGCRLGRPKRRLLSIADLRIPGRSFEILDMGADAAKIAVGTLLGALTRLANYLPVVMPPRRTLTAGSLSALRIPCATPSGESHALCSTRRIRWNSAEPSTMPWRRSARFGGVGSTRKAKSPGAKWRRGDGRLIPVCFGLIPDDCFLRGVLATRASLHGFCPSLSCRQSPSDHSADVRTQGETLEAGRSCVPTPVEGRKRWVYAEITLKGQTSDGDGNSNHSIPTALCSRQILGERAEEIIGTIE